MRRGIQVAKGRAADHTCRILQIKRPIKRVHDMTGHIAQCAGTEIPPATPVPGSINGIVRTFPGRADKQVPVQRLGTFHDRFRFLQTLRPDRTIGPAMYLIHISYYTGLYPFRHLAAPVERVALVTHLCRHLIFFSQTGKQTGFVNRMCKRFLGITMLAQRNCMGGHTGMGMVRGSHHYSID